MLRPLANADAAVFLTRPLHGVYLEVNYLSFFDLEVKYLIFVYFEVKYLIFLFLFYISYFEVKYPRARE